MELTKRHIMGFAKEDELKPLIEDVLGCDLDETDRYSSIDFINTDEKILVELKSRTNLYDTYPTTLMNTRKLSYIHQRMTRGYRAYFFFDFVDGTYYMLYDPAHTHRTDDEYLYIPIECLTKVNPTERTD